MCSEILWQSCVNFVHARLPSVRRHRRSQRKGNLHPSALAKIMLACPTSRAKLRELNIIVGRRRQMNVWTGLRAWPTGPRLRVGSKSTNSTSRSLVCTILEPCSSPARSLGSAQGLCVRRPSIHCERPVMLLLFHLSSSAASSSLRLGIQMERPYFE